MRVAELWFIDKHRFLFLLLVEMLRKLSTRPACYLRF